MNGLIGMKYNDDWIFSSKRFYKNNFFDSVLKQWKSYSLVLLNGTLLAMPLTFPLALYSPDLWLSCFSDFAGWKGMKRIHSAQAGKILNFFSFKCRAFTGDLSGARFTSS